MYTEKELAEKVRYAYSHGDFDVLFPLMEEDYEHISFWVLEVIRGKAAAVRYYTGKGRAIRAAGTADISTGLVRITKAPDRVRPNGVFRNGVRHIEDAAFLHRSDANKIGVLMHQTVNGEDVCTLAIPTVSENGLLRQVLIANPDLYAWEPVED